MSLPERFAKGQGTGGDGSRFAGVRLGAAVRAGSGGRAGAAAAAEPATASHRRWRAPGLER